MNASQPSGGRSPGGDETGPGFVTAWAEMGSATSRNPGGRVYDVRLSSPHRSVIVAGGLPAAGAPIGGVTQVRHPKDPARDVTNVCSFPEREAKNPRRLKAQSVLNIKGLQAGANRTRLHQTQGAPRC